MTTTHSPSSAQSAEREAFEELMRSRGEDHLYRRDVPGCEKFGEYCRQNVQDQWEVWQARAQATKAVATIREGEIAIAVPNGAFDALMSALERADDKGYMPDAMREEWLAFDWRPLRPDATPPSPAAASAHTIGEDAANGAIGEREAHCVNTCNFYNKNRPCECPAPQSDAAAWEAIFDRVAVELNCLPSSSPDGNEHVFHAIAKLRAALTAAQTNRDYEVENALTDALSALIDKIKPGLDCGNIIEDAKAASDALDESRLYTAPQPVQTERALTNDSRDAARYRWLRETLHGAKAGGGVEVNERRQVYEEPVQEEEVRVYWYQHTPVGFYESQASTLDAAIDDAMTAAQPASSLAEGDKQ